MTLSHQPSIDSTFAQTISDIQENLLRHYLKDEYDYVDQTVKNASQEAIKTAIMKRDNYKRKEAELIGVAEILDSLWDGSYYSMGKLAADRIETEMVYYFGENWMSDMYDFMLRDGESFPSCHPVHVVTASELSELEHTKPQGKDTI